MNKPLSGRLNVLQFRYKVNGLSEIGYYGSMPSYSTQTPEELRIQHQLRDFASLTTVHVLNVDVEINEGISYIKLTQEYENPSRAEP